MQAYDVLMLIVVVLAIVWGAWKGLAWQVASIASIALSYVIALRFRAPLSGVINAAPPWNIFLSMLILFLGTGLIVWLGFNLVSEFIERVKLKEFDRQLGAVFGAAKGVLLCVLVTLFSVALLGDAQRQAICQSRSGYYIAVLLDRANPLIPHELHEVLAPYLDRLDKTIPHPHTAQELAEAERELTGGLIPKQAPATNWQAQPQGNWQAAPPAKTETVFAWPAWQQPKPATTSFSTDDSATMQPPAGTTAGHLEAQRGMPADLRR
jgi:membrane protein required for colicin V production